MLQGTIKRDSSTELLRIISIILIIIGHFSYHGFDVYEIDNTVLRRFVELGRVGGQVGVNCFVLISGYYGIRDYRKTKERILNIASSVWFYSIVVFLVAFFVLSIKVQLFDIVSVFFPVITKSYWFATAYIILLVVAPFINYALDCMDDLAYKKCITCIIIVWCIIPTIFTSDMYGNEITWFFVLYVLGGFLRKNKKQFLNRKHLLLLAIFFFVCTWLTEVFIDFLSIKIHFLIGKQTFFLEGNKIPIVLTSLCLFCWCMSVQIKYIPIINYFGSITFAIYLLHDNFIVRKNLWNWLISFFDINNAIRLFIAMLLVVVTLFLCTSIIEYIRKKTFEWARLLFERRWQAFGKKN